MNVQGIVNIKARLATLAAAAVLAACSAGGSTSTTTPPTSGTPTASDLVVSVDKSSVNSTGTDTATVTVTAVDANRNAVAAIPVTITPDSNALVAVSGTTTSTTGVVTGTVSIGTDHSNRTIDVLVTSGSLKKTVTVAVTGAALQAAVGSATPGATATIQYHLVDGGNNDIINTPITVTLGTQTPVAGTTDANGKYTFTYTVPNTATVAVSAKAAGVQTDSTVTTTSSTTAAATGTVKSASLSANPSNIPINAGTSTANQVDVRALFVGASNAPIQYTRVRFDLAGDVNGIGGTLTSGTGYVYSDANGVARTTYIPGSRSSGNQALTIRACWSEADFTAPACPNAVTASVTVVSSGVSLAILTNGLIGVDDAKNSYTQSFAVQVVDSVGQPISGVTVAGSIDIPRFYRGVYQVASGRWEPGVFDGATPPNFLPFVTQSCDNEDVNRNDIMESYGTGQQEDMNGSTTLEPFKASAAIATTSSGSNVTDSFGKAYFTLQYGQNYATWEDVVLTFTTTVQGTEGHNTYSSGLPVPATTLTNTTVSPPYQVSPYNFATLPQVVGTTTVTDPASGKSGKLCQAQP